MFKLVPTPGVNIEVWGCGGGAGLQRLNSVVSPPRVSCVLTCKIFSINRRVLNSFGIISRLCGAARGSSVWGQRSPLGSPPPRCAARKLQREQNETRILSVASFLAGSCFPPDVPSMVANDWALYSAFAVPLLLSVQARSSAPLSLVPSQDSLPF